MKLDRIRLENFLSHDRTDWSPNGSRLVALVGPNGAGKSSLAVDATLYALFDDARAKTDDLVRLGSTDMSVSIEFLHDGGHYRVTRGRTTRSGGRTFLELHAAERDGTWRSLTGATIRDTQASIEELLRVDAATFESAVVLVQGDAMRFAQATAAERKRIVSTILGLDVYARAERRARDRDLELSQALRDQRGRLERLDDAIAELAPVAGRLALREADVVAIAADLEAAARDRETSETRLRDLAVLIAGGEAAEGQVAAVEAEIANLRERFRRARERRDSAKRMFEMATTTLGAEASVAESVTLLPELRAEVERLEGLEADAARLDDRIRREQNLQRDAREPFERAYIAWQADRKSMVRQVDALAAAVVALEPIECPNCQHRWSHDQADLQGKLQSARHTLRDLEAAEPKAPAGQLTSAAAVASMERRRERIGDVRPSLNDARGALSRHEMHAARADAIEAARATRLQASEDVGAADIEMAETTETANAAVARIADLRAKAAETASFREERSAVLERTEELARRTADHTRQHADAIASVATLRANLERLEAFQAERAELTATIDATVREASLMKRLVTAFGVTGIPARIIEGVLPELTGYAQELLSELRSGMTLSLRAQRASRDGKGVIEALDLVVQDSAGERPLGLFSGGEKVSVCLALAVGLSRLVARRAGAALRTLVVDEPDGLDADARRAFGQALRVLAHRGELERTVLVSHHSDLAEYADEVYELRKGPAGSTVELAA